MAGEHYFSEVPSVSSRPSVITLGLPDMTLRLATDRGVFAAGDVDPGTRLLLLEGAEPPIGGEATFLDLGCGYGPIAVTLARRAPLATVWAVDVNQRALALCRTNADNAGVGDQVHTAAPDEVPDDVRFDGIWSNPPVRVGKAALHTLLERWLPRLVPGAPAVLVVNRHLGADSLAEWLQAQDWNVERVCSRAGYRLLRVSR